jgi:hypothetical protein
MDGEHKADAFSQSLADLKRRGCSLLITGPVRDGTHLQLSRRLLGNESAAPHRQLVVVTDCNGGGDRHPEGTVDEDTYRVIDRRPAMRSVAVCASSASLDISTLEREMADAIDAFAVADGGLSPSELRVCVDSLQPLVDRYGIAGVEQFLATVTERIRETNGMGHFHFPIDLDCETVTELSPLFDVIIEVQPGKHRWHLLADDILTEWLPM